MRPYRFRMRLSSRRLNVTRFGNWLAVAVRATARFSLGSVSSDIELIERLLSYHQHDCANRRAPQGAIGNTMKTATACPVSRGFLSHGNVSGIILLPHFRPSPAPVGCEKTILRWPGPFGSGFLSPQPPGAVGIGPVRRGSYSRYWANESWSFFVCGQGLK